MGLANVERLEEALHSKGADSERAMRLALVRLLAAMKDRRENGSTHSKDFFVSALGALRRIKGTLHAEARMECINHCVQYLYSNGNSADALNAATQLQSLTRLVQNRHWIRIAENTSGIVKADLGNVPDAIAHYYNAIAMADELGNDHAKATSLVNLGVAFNYGGLYREAIPCFKRAESLSKEKPLSHELQASAAGNLAQSYMYLGEFAEGFDAIKRALKWSGEPTTDVAALSRTIREFTFVQLALELGKVEEARSHAQQCTFYATQSRTSRGRFVAAVGLALCDIHAGDVNRALQVIETELPNDHDSHPLKIVALSCLVKAYDQAGMPSKALELMQALLSQIREVRENSVASLLTGCSLGMSDSDIQPEERDLRALQFRHATLSARAAEHALLQAHMETLERLAVTADLKEDSSGQHGYRVGRLSMLLAADLNWKKDACYFLESAARLHDLGKIAVPDRILLSSEHLRDAQREVMFAHAQVGGDLLSKSTNPQLRMAERIARHHHEWWNGTGYPAHLAGERIPLPARMVALADVFDALTHGRPYAEAWSTKQAIEEISRRRGTQFDPKLTDAFLTMIARLTAAHEDLDSFLSMAATASPFAIVRSRIRALLSAEHRTEVVQ